MLHIGCHLSSSKGFAAMGRQALELGADTFQFFTRNPRGSKAKELDPADAAVLMLEKDCSASALLEEITRLLTDGERYDRMSKALQNMVVIDCAERLCEIMEKLAKQKACK